MQAMGQGTIEGTMVQRAIKGAMDQREIIGAMDQVPIEGATQKEQCMLQAIDRGESYGSGSH